jgi:hypothetical protein
MKPSQIAADIARGLEIRATMRSLKVELDAIETRLEAAGLEGEQIPLQDADREGKQFLARGEDKIIPIRFESDLIAGSFQPDSVMHKAVVHALGTDSADKLPAFFKDTRTFERVPKDGKQFRQLARELLTADRFAALIQAATQRGKGGIAKSKTVIAWDDAKPIDQVAAV